MKRMQYENVEETPARSKTTEVQMLFVWLCIAHQGVQLDHQSSLQSMAASNKISSLLFVCHLGCQSDILGSLTCHLPVIVTSLQCRYNFLKIWTKSITIRTNLYLWSLRRRILYQSVCAAIRLQGSEEEWKNDSIDLTGKSARPQKFQSTE